MPSPNNNIAKFEIIIQGTVGNEPVSPSNYDISDLSELLNDINILLRKPLQGNDTKFDISLNYGEGSLKLRLFAAVLAINSLFSDLTPLSANNDLSLINPLRAGIIAKWQNFTKTNNTFSYSFIDANSEIKLKIDKDTDYMLPPPQFVEVEYIFYGEITDIGGKTNPNIHIDTNLGSFTISCSKEVLIGKNLLYSICGIQALVQQEINTCVISKDNIKFISFIDYKGNMPTDVLSSFISKSNDSWADIDDSVNWVRKIRGYGD